MSRSRPGPRALSNCRSETGFRSAGSRSEGAEAVPRGKPTDEGSHLCVPSERERPASRRSTICKELPRCSGPESRGWWLRSRPFSLFTTIHTRCVRQSSACASQCCAHLNQARQTSTFATFKCFNQAAHCSTVLCSLSLINQVKERRSCFSPASSETVGFGVARSWETPPLIPPGDVLLAVPSVRSDVSFVQVAR